MDDSSTKGGPQTRSDADRYTDVSRILNSEKIYGTGFQSPGGLSKFKALILPELPQLSSGHRVLDIGSGLGGAAFFLAQRFGVHVVGLDNAPLMVELSEARAASHPTVGFVTGDLQIETWTRESFDHIYSQDTFLYIADKVTSFERSYYLLKPGGRFVVSDFLKGKESPQIAKYERDSGFSLITQEEYVSGMLSVAEWHVDYRDVSRETVDSLKNDLLAASEALSHLSFDERSHFVERWENKIDLLESGQLRQGIFTATKSKI